jgi:hypothetical protein
MATAPNGTIASATTPYVTAGPTAAAVGQVRPAVRATIAPGHTSNSRAISTPNDKPTALVWLPK